MAEPGEQTDYHKDGRPLNLSWLPHSATLSASSPASTIKIPHPEAQSPTGVAVFPAALTVLSRDNGKGWGGDCGRDGGRREGGGDLGFVVQELRSSPAETRGASGWDELQ